MIRGLDRTRSPCDIQNLRPGGVVDGEKRIGCSETGASDNVGGVEWIFGGSGSNDV